MERAGCEDISSTGEAAVDTKSDPEAIRKTARAKV
jgi:hypothetical protein